jgi:hypothetical protein
LIYDILRQRREIILKEWQKSTLDFYATGAFKSAKKSVDRFGNPIVYTVSTGLETILDELIEGIHTAKSDEALEDVIKIRSLQTEKPSQTLEFLFYLKKIFKDELGGRAGEKDDFEEIEKLYTALDNLILSAFDIYMKCREKIYEIKSNEIKRMSYKLWERAGMTDPSLMRKGDCDDDDS